MEINKRKLVEKEVGWKAGEADTQGQGGGRKCKRLEREVGGSWRRPFQTWGNEACGLNLGAVWLWPSGALMTGSGRPSRLPRSQKGRLRSLSGRPGSRQRTFKRTQKRHGGAQAEQNLSKDGQKRDMKCKKGKPRGFHFALVFPMQNRSGSAYWRQ